MNVPLLEIPAGDREVAAAPARSAWAQLLDENRTLVDSWDGIIGGVPVGDLRASARHEALAAARRATERTDGSAPPAGSSGAPIVMTGHQPLLYHPGVWSKVFLTSALAHDTGGTAIECVVDTDGVERLALTVPCRQPRIERCAIELHAPEWPDAYFAALPAPTRSSVEDFMRRGLTVLGTLGLPDAESRFAEFCELLGDRERARDAAEAVTGARRAFEASADLRYQVLPVSDECASATWHHFVAAVSWEAERFAQAHNAVLSEHRLARGIRSTARPFPDLAEDGEGVELPFWFLDGRSRVALWARRVSSGVELRARGESVAHVREAGDSEAISRCGGTVAPRAVTLTMFNRLLVADLFVHGVGGAGYDGITDEVVRRMWGIALPAYAAATLTMRLPLGLPDDPEPRVAELRQRLHRLEHNPDRLLAEVVLDGDAGEAARALTKEKQLLTDAIGEPGADKKTLGARIRAVNEQMAQLVEPLRIEAAAELDRLETTREEAAVLSDRTYPFMLWDPRELRDILA